MEVKQIATNLNEWMAEKCADARYDETTSAEFIVKEDLSNIVDIGTRIYDAGWVDNFVKAMIDRIGRMVFVNRRTRGFAPNLQRDGWEFGSVMSKSRTKRFEAKPNPSWQLQKGQTVNQYQFEPPTVKTKYYNIKVAWQIDCSFAEMQVREAFTSAGEMNRFFSMIESAIQQSLDDQMDLLTMRAVNGFIAEKIDRSSGIIDLLTPYNSAESASLTLDSMTQSNGWCTWAAYQILLAKQRIKARTSVFNANDEAGYDTATPPEYLRFCLHGDVAEALNVYLNAVTYHNDFDDIGSYDIIPMWQTAGTNWQRAATTRINIDLPSNIEREAADAKSVDRIGILGVMFDTDAIVINNENQRVTSSYNANGEYYNNFYKVDTNIIIDLEENGIVFVAGTGTPPSVTISGTATAAVSATSTLTGTTVPAGGTVKWYSADEDIATVGESTGVVTGVAAGKVDIIAVYTTSDGLEYSDSVEFTVTAEAKSKK
jgi:Bacterial surface proteins containing Ig-like domains